MLTEKQIDAIYFEALGSQHLRPQDRAMVTRFAEAVEAEVRKQDTELIRQLVEALEKADKVSGYPNNKKAIAAGRARLNTQEGTDHG